jgi:hypothetical protein
MEKIKFRFPSFTDMISDLNRLKKLTYNLVSRQIILVKIYSII